MQNLAASILACCLTLPASLAMAQQAAEPSNRIAEYEPWCGGPKALAPCVD